MLLFIIIIPVLTNFKNNFIAFVFTARLNDIGSVYVGGVAGVGWGEGPFWGGGGIPVDEQFKQWLKTTCETFVIFLLSV